MRILENSTILITGGAGFIGSNFVHHMISCYPNCKIINIDKLTYAGNPENLKTIKTEKYDFIKGDIANKELINNIFSKYNIDIVVNFAAESHVDRSIHDISPFIDTNISGTVNLLEAAKKSWNNNLDKKLFIQISTDEVYGSLGKTGKFTENTPLSPQNPYSSTKASADMIALAFVNTHKLPVIVTRCSNNYGPYQFPEKLIPLTLINILNEKEIPIYGDGKQIRDWIYVEDHCEGIKKAILQGKIGEVYNFGGESEIYNLNLVHNFCELCDEFGLSNNSKKLITHIKDRPGHDRRYAMDITKVKTELNWQPKHSLKEALKKTVIWYSENKNWWQNLLTRDYQSYYSMHYGNQK